MISPLLFTIFKKGSKTYFYSSLFFPPKIRESVFALYGFVRVIDDFVDAVPQQKAELNAFLKDYERAKQGKETNNVVIKTFVAVQKKYSFEQAWIDAFIATMRQDLHKSKYAVLKETEQYMYGSAEVIGLMMAKILGLPPKSYHAAQMLGKAMQFANFIRDLQEDVELGRCYFPQNELKRFGLKDLTSETAATSPKEFNAFMQFQIQRYHSWQKKAEDGYRYLPIRYRISIQTAGDLYLWATKEISKRPSIVFEKKVKPSVQRVVFHLMMNAVRIYWQPLIQISRPRFWLYILGPYVIGYIAGMGQSIDVFQLWFWIGFCYFLFPANFFLYGINDLADQDTDRLNPKKGTKEHKLEHQHLGMLKFGLVTHTVISAALILFMNSIPLKTTFLIFWFLSFAYSHPPFRWKARPIIDSVSNFLYIVPGIFGFILASQHFPPNWVLFCGACWTAAMHLFSAVPDIEADRKVKLLTTAVTFGRRNSLLICSFLWLICALVTFYSFPSIWMFSLLIYPVIPLLVLSGRANLEKTYWVFPYLNGVVGCYFFWLIFIQRFIAV